jgi:hypothetical protein
MAMKNCGLFEFWSGFFLGRNLSISDSNEKNYIQRLTLHSSFSLNDELPKVQTLAGE